MVVVGNKILEWEVEDQDGNIVSSKDLKGKKYILFFYPKDNTPGCTKEVCNLRDNYDVFTNSEYLLFGVSPDDKKKHNKFIDKFKLPFPLLADTEHKVIETFGVWGEKNFMGKTYDGLIRTTFVVNEKGVVSHVVNKVKTANHTSQLQEILAL